MNHEGECEFQNIYSAFNEKIRRYPARLVGEHEAEDLTQEVFCFCRTKGYLQEDISYDIDSVDEEFIMPAELRL